MSLLAGGLMLFGLIPAQAGSISKPAAPDPVLGGAPGPCDPRLGQAQFVPGTDVGGHPVARADFEAGEIPMPKQILMPLKSRGAKGEVPLAAIENPVPAEPPACPSH